MCNISSESVHSTSSEIDDENDDIFECMSSNEIHTRIDKFGAPSLLLREACSLEKEDCLLFGKEDNGGGGREDDSDEKKNYFNNNKVRDVSNPSPDDVSKRSPRRRKKKKRRKLTICTINCKYEVVRRIAAKFGMKEVAEESQWNVYWTDLSVSIERAKEMKRFQKINHFPGMAEICRKDLLARNLTRMLKIFPKDYNFFPKSWCLPADLGEAVTYARSKRNRTYICKPETGCQGRGIFLTKNLKDIKPFERMICQVYLAKPFLIDGYKFDLRVYVLITSCDPLRIYVYNDGLVRFATSRYQEPTHSNTTNVFMHLTNYAVNKHSRTYVVDDEAGSKRKCSTLNKWLEKKDYNIKEMWSRIDDVIIKTIVAAHPVLRHSYNACFPCHDYTYACFELLGFDILLDYRLKPFILEVNHSPSFHTDAQIDRDIKESLLMDTFNILNLNQTDRRRVLEEDRKRVQERLLHGIHKTNNSETYSVPSPEKLSIEMHETQVAWEERHMGNYRCIYPGRSSEKYAIFFNQNQSSLFQDTTASRAREECSRLQRLERESKAKIEASKRLGSKAKDLDRVCPESPCSKESVKLKSITLPKRKPPMLVKKTDIEVKARSLCSFQPDPIVEIEERERVMGMAQRDFLIRSFGVLDQICLLFQRNGRFTPEDEKKYGVYGKVGNIQEISPAISNKLPSVFSSHISKYSLPKQTENNGPENQSSETMGDKLQKVSESVPMDEQAGLSITCNNAPILMRPHIPRAIWVDFTKERDVRITKAHVARTFTNSVKLQELEKREHRQLHSGT